MDSYLINFCNKHMRNEQMNINEVQRVADHIADQNKKPRVNAGLLLHINDGGRTAIEFVKSCAAYLEQAYSMTSLFNRENKFIRYVF